MMDMHCHVDLYPNYKDVIKECVELGIYVLSVTTTPKAWEGTYALTKDCLRFQTALGLHPQLAHERYHELPLFDSLIDKTRYIGEIGLDGSRSFKEYFEIQLKVFQHILEKCSEVQNKILSIHSLQATKEVIDFLELYRKSGTPILHWYLGSKKDMYRAIELGAYFSIGPAMLYSQQGKKVISWLPKDRVLLETDGPFVKIQQEAAKPKDTSIVRDYLCSIWNITIEECNGILKNNLKTLLVEKCY